MKRTQENKYLGIFLDALSVFLIFFLYFKALTPLKPTFVLNIIFITMMFVIFLIIELRKYSLNNRIPEIEAKTKELIPNGFEYNTKFKMACIILSILFIILIMLNFHASYDIHAKFYKDASRGWNRAVSLSPYIIVLSSIIPISIFRYIRSKYYRVKMKYLYAKSHPELNKQWQKELSKMNWPQKVGPKKSTFWGQYISIPMLFIYEYYIDFSLLYTLLDTSMTR